MKESSDIHKRLLAYQHELREPVRVVHHPNEDSYWKRAEFGSPSYDRTTPYNHRTVFPSEIVIEYDNEDKRLNYKLAQRVIRKLANDGISYSMWFSGNKSTHIHAFFDMQQPENRRVLKRSILLKYATIHHRGTKYKPDLNVASQNHLIRAEHGVHESTGRQKSFIDEHVSFPKINRVPMHVWEYYNDYMKEHQVGSDDYDEDLVDAVAQHDGFKWMLNPENVKSAGDGRKRGLWFITNILRWTKYQDQPEKLKNFVKWWYKEAGGRKYSEHDIEQKVDASLEKDYTPGFRFMNELLSDMGAKRLISDEPRNN